MTTVQQLCDAMANYYKSLNKPYDNIFSTYCDDNGLEDEHMQQELENEPSECMLTDFDEDFPLMDEAGTEEDKKKQIFDIIKMLYDNPDKSFDANLPEINAELFETIDENDIDAIQKLYRKQCPTVYNKGMKQDNNLLYVLAVSRKFKFDYLLNLVDMYDRDRVVEVENTQYNESLWVQKSDHIKERNTVAFKLGQQPAKYDNLCKTAVASFGNRCCGRLVLNSNKKINDSLPEIVEYIDSSITFIANIAEANPFQLDISICVGKPITVTKTESDGDDGGDQDGDSDDDKVNEDSKQNEDFVDFIGDIEAKLQNNKLKYVKEELKGDADEYKDKTIFDELLKKFKEKNEIKQDSMDYLKKKRLIVFIDRRESKNNDGDDTFYLFKPFGKYTGDIPDAAVAEWGISASRTCLLPNMNYQVSDAIGDPDANARNKEVDTKGKNPSEDKLIGSADHCKGSLLTLSFHVRAKNKIKMYIYFNGQILRFMANEDDFKRVLPKLFVDNDKNKGFLKIKDLDTRIERMRAKLVDKEFKAFREC